MQLNGLNGLNDARRETGLAFTREKWRGVQLEAGRGDADSTGIGTRHGTGTHAGTDTKWRGACKRQWESIYPASRP